MLGEIHTGLLRHSAPITNAMAQRVLSRRLGDAVRSSVRPVSYVVSPDLYDGLDCRLSTASGAGPRAVGTAASFAAITGGQILQTATTVTAQRGETSRRMPWSHYLARPGVIETLGSFPDERVATGWPAADTPNLGAIGKRLFSAVQRSPDLGGRPPFRATRTRLRWVLTEDADNPRIEFSMESDELRTVRMAGTGLQPREVADFCADLALHDWLLSVLLDIIDRSRLDSSGDRMTVDPLRDAIDNVLHHWMPAARLGGGMQPFWDGVDRASGLTRQWQAQVERIRNHLAVRMLDRLDVTAQPLEGSLRSAAGNV
nr:SCO2521 family protein [Cryptosporangium aurantiacum]